MPRYLIVAFFLVAFLITSLHSLDTTPIIYKITTVAGGGGLGDGSLATNAVLNDPNAISFGPNGDMYICDTGAHKIRKVSASDGTISTIAGSGSAGFSGDGGLASSAQLYLPRGVFVSNMSDIYIADWQNHRIRKVSAVDGKISTIAGNGSGGYNGDGILATSAQLHTPSTVIMSSSGDFLIADTANHRIRKISAVDGKISTIAGNGNAGSSGDNSLATSAQLYHPQSISETLNGDIIVSDAGNSKIRKISVVDGKISTIAGNGIAGYSGDNSLATSAQLSYPQATGVAPSGDLYVADTGNNKMRKVSANGGIITHFSGTGEQEYNGDNILASIASLCAPRGIVTVSHNGTDFIYVADTCNNRIRQAYATCPEHATLSSGVCICDNGYYGEQCKVFDCSQVMYNSSDVCSKHGNCLAPNNCSCHAGYYGDNCQFFDCNGTIFNDTAVCSSHGQCIGPNNCSCSNNYYGNNCEQFNCFGVKYGNISVCSGHGSCQYPDNCTCDANYSGENCEWYSCFDIARNSSQVCSGHGSCVVHNNCSCDSQYYGLDCSSFDCFGIEHMNSSNCSSHGSCLSPNNCSCNAGYYGSTCQLHNCYGIQFNNSNVCTGNGQCVSPDRCTCKAGFYGLECSDFDCFGIQKNSSNVCFGSGGCQAPNNCSCNSGYFAFDCSYHQCYGYLHNDTLNVCNGHGSCLSPNNCSCQSGYYGNNCEFHNCYGALFNGSAVCSGHGSCVSPNNCSCSTGYYGSICSDFNCYEFQQNSSDVCSKYGSCLSPNNCTCYVGYFGSDCSNFTCSGVSHFEVGKVCSSHGSCKSPENCTCQPGYYGSNCEIHNCYGIQFNNSNICTGNGVCSSPNSCTCKAGYYGLECSDFDCFAIQKNSSNVCFGNGGCQAPNNCSCNSGYFAFDCSYHQCFGYLHNDTLNVCNGHGSCLSPNNCSCQAGYFGTDCELFNCFNLLFNDSDVCSGHGHCNSNNNCTCSQGFASTDCSINISPFEVNLTQTEQVIYLGVDNKNVSVSIIVVDESLRQSPNISYSWTCLQCDGQNVKYRVESNRLVINSTLNDVTRVGNYTFMATTSIANIEPFSSRKSNNAQFTLIVKYDLNDPTLGTFGLPSVLVSGLKEQTVSTVINSITLNQTTIRNFLSCNYNCSSSVSYGWSVRAGVFTQSASGPSVAKFSNSNQMTFSPPIFIQSIVPSNYLNESVVLTLTVYNNKQQGISSSVEIQVVSPAKPAADSSSNSTSISKLMNISPIFGVSMNEKFTIQVAEWSASPQLLPLRYAIGYFDKTKSVSIRLTEYSPNTTFTSYLPYIRSSGKRRSILEETSETIQLVVFVQDVLGNIASESSVNVTVSPFNGTQQEYIEIVKSLSGESLLIATVDQTFTSVSSSLVSTLITNIIIDPKNPSSSLSSLESLTSNNGTLTSQTVTQVINKLDTFLSNMTDQYLSELEIYGFVKTALSNSDILTTVQIISNCFTTEFDSEKVKSIANGVTLLIYYSTIPTVLDSNSLVLPSKTFKSEMVTITVSSFYLTVPNANLQTIDNSVNSVGMNLTSIMAKYDALSVTCGATMIVYSKNTNFDQTTSNLTVSSNVNDFKFMKKVNVLTLDNIEPIILSFSVSTLPTYVATNLTTTNNTYQCKYWDESSKMWSSYGCSLYRRSSNFIECACTHTTMFTTFLESKTTRLTTQLKEQVSSLYYAQISFGIIYLIVASSILIGLILMRKSQPVSSRLLTPYVGLIALIVECVLIYIVQRSVLVDQLNSSNSQMWETGDTAANIIANIVMIIVNTLNLTAIFCYVLQVFRFQFMKLLYKKLSENRTTEQSTKVLKALKYSTSQALFYSLICVFACVNVVYWIIWVALRRTNLISSSEYTYIVSISYTVCILAFGLCISAVAILDMTLSSKKQIETKNKRQAINFSEQRFSLKLDGGNVVEKKKTSILSLFDWLTTLDGPLYFRIEMFIYIVSFILLILNQVIGLSSLSYRFENLVMFKIALNIDSVSFIFEVLYIISYLLVFGGYALIVAIMYKVKKQHSNQTIEKKRNEEVLNQELYSTLELEEGYELFAKFCEKEFSTENLFIFSDLKKNDHIVQGEDLSDLVSFVDRIYETYIKVGATYEVNIPSKSRNSFIQLYQKCNKTTTMDASSSAPPVDSETVQDCFLAMTKQVVMNLGDTFSRFVFTPDYMTFKAVRDTQLQLIEKANVVYGI